jgi:large subunit ribosomal protein L33
MARNDKRVQVTLECTTCKRRNYITMKNKLNDRDPQNWNNPVFILSILLVLGLQIAHIFVMGHIFRHAMTYTMTAGVATAMGYAVVNYALIRLVFA